MEGVEGTDEFKKNRVLPNDVSHLHIRLKGENQNKDAYSTLDGRHWMLDSCSTLVGRHWMREISNNFILLNWMSENIKRAFLANNKRTVRAFAVW